MVDELCLIQANVGTLNPKKACQSSVKHDLSCTPRTVILDSLFVAADVVFLQEGRLPEEGEQKCYNFNMFRAAATSIGSGGSQIWLKRRLAKYFAAMKAYSPWLVRVTLAFGPLSIHLFSGHAPYVKDTQESRIRRRRFWQDFNGAVAESTADPPQCAFYRY